MLYPDETFILDISDVIDSTNTEYQQYLNENNDIDNAEELADIMNSLLQAYDLDHIYIDVGIPFVNAIDWYIQNAMVDGDGDITVMLDPTSIDGYWGPKTFKYVLLKTFEHEDIHMRQRDRMGEEKYNTLPSGYMKGVALMKKTGNQQDMKRLYFRDPQELMAHGHDLFREIERSANPDVVLRNPELYREELPTYDKHRAVFPANAKPLRRLLSYAARYYCSG